MMPVVHNPIKTNSDLDVYPTHEAKLGKGGYRTVANIAERDNIPFERCEVGMLVTVLEDNTNNNLRTTYVLKQKTIDSRTWEKFSNEKIYDKFIVIAVAGQSNAVGYDESPVKEIYSTSKDEARIRQLGLYGDDNLKIIPLGWCAQNLQDMRPNNRPGTATAGTKGIHLPLANELLPYIPEDFGILILPIAFGGGWGFNGGNNGTYDPQLMKPTNTGPNAGQGTVGLKWGVGSAYYQTLRDRIKYALSLNENNRFGGIVWCQGESDIDDRNNHKIKFEEMTSQLFTELNNAGYGSRTPKGTFDRDIWYNMETVGYWYLTKNCRLLWDQYKKWNPNTYIEINGAESNIINGTGTTSSVMFSQFGNDAFSKVVAPAVAKALIRGNEFSKLRTDREITKDNVGEVNPEKTFGFNLERYRTAVRDDFSVNHSSVTFSVDDQGNVTSSATLSGKFAFNTCEPFVDFGDIYELDFEVSRHFYYVVYEADLSRRNFSNVVIGGTNRTGEINSVLNGTNTRKRNAEDGNDIWYSFVSGDRVKIIRNRDYSITFYRTHQANGKYQFWFNLPRINLTDGKPTLGFFFGVSNNEAQGVGAGDVTLFKKLKIQKEEALVSEKYLKNELTSVYLKIQSLETTVSNQTQTIADLTNRIAALESPSSP